MNAMLSTECFAVRGRTIIDTIDSRAGLTHIYSKTLEQIKTERPEYASAERMTIDEFCQGKAQAQDTPMTWLPSTEEAYWDALEALPPAAMGNGGFLLGEPEDHHAGSGLPRYTAYRAVYGEYVVSSRPLTVPEFNAL